MQHMFLITVEHILFKNQEGTQLMNINALDILVKLKVDL